jgi:mannose-6-phosphate isomerase
MFVGITNTPRDYAWGSTTAIADLLGTAPSGGPEAELWLGAHPGSPSMIRGTDAPVSSVVDGRLPFLLKVLAAASPLSLQAHPTSGQAAAGFARENALGIPVDAPDRNYRDAFHKPELIYALEDGFRALCGFRTARAISSTVERMIEAVPGDSALNGFSDRLGEDEYLRSAFEWLLTGGDDVDELIEATVAAAALLDGANFTLVGELAEAYPGDPGIVISLMLNLVTLKRGEVLYLPAGNIHAYVEGIGIELMAASDNVLRGGLTPKHVDIPELLSVLDFTPVPVPYLAPEPISPGVSLYSPDVPDFELAVFELDGSSGTLPITGPAIALCTAGSVSLTGALGSFALARGEAAYVSADEAQLLVAGAGTVFVATTGR